MISVRPVTTSRERSIFASFANRMYKDNPYWVPDLEIDVLDSLTPPKFADIQLFLAWDGEEVVGRVAGIINHKSNERWNVLNARFGYLDFVDRPEVSSALLGAVEEWGRAHGMTRMQGPMGITDFDKEGMLVEDFDQMGDFVSYYNAPYYKDHMEAHGYTKEADWISIKIQVPQALPKRFQRIVELAPDMFGLHTRRLSWWDIFVRGDGLRFFHLLNKAYEPLFGFVQFSDAQIRRFLRTYIPLIDMRLISIVETDDGQLVGAAVSMGSLSHAIRKSGGRLLPFGWWHLIKALKFSPEDTATMLLIGVHPDYQGAGVNALLFADQLQGFKALGFKYAETGPQLEDNVKELSQWKLLDPTYLKRRRCYTKKI